MLYYDPGRWAISYAFAPGVLAGSVIPRTFALASSCAVLSFMLCFLLNHIAGGRPTEPTLDDEIHLRRMLSNDARVAIASHAFVLGSILVFRVNQAFSRYWSCVGGIRQVKAKWFNATSTAFSFCSADPAKAQAVWNFQQQVVRFASMMYCAALASLESVKCRHEMINNEGMDLDSLRFLDQSDDRAEVLMQWTQKLVVNAVREGTIDAAPPLVTRIFQELGQGMFELMHVRKVNETPIPFPYAQLLTCLLIIHYATTLFALPFVLDNELMVAISSFISVFAYSGAYYLAHEIERPFGDGVNDLPMTEYSKSMNRSLFALLDPRTQTVPSINFARAKEDFTVRECRSFVGDSPSDHQVVYLVADDEAAGGVEGDGVRATLLVPPNACRALRPPKRPSDEGSAVAAGSAASPFLVELQSPSGLDGSALQAAALRAYGTRGIRLPGPRSVGAAAHPHDGGTERRPAFCDLELAAMAPVHMVTTASGQAAARAQPAAASTRLLVDFPAQQPRSATPR